MSAHLRLSPFDIFIDPLLDLQDQRLRELLIYWNGKRAGRAMPARADVSPADIVSHLPSIFLIGVAPPAVSPAHFHVRLMGTALNELFADDFTGETLVTASRSRPPRLRKCWAWSVKSAVRSGFTGRPPSTRRMRRWNSRRCFCR